MPRYKCTIEYDGTGLCGWQRQDEAPSVQQHIEEAIFAFTGQNTKAHTSGRTDAGVHALAQVIHFDLDEEFEAFKVMSAVNHHLKPEKIAILDAQIVSDEFHARFSAKKRYYLYRIVNRRAPLVIDFNRAWYVPQKLDVENMREGAKYLIGNHDFTSFRAAKCEGKSPIKTVDKIEIEQNGDLIEIYVEAKSFLHHMVRNIVGTLKMVGQGKADPEYVKDILDARDRRKAGVTAAAEGLYFLKVDY